MTKTTTTPFATMLAEAHFCEVLRPLRIAVVDEGKTELRPQLESAEAHQLRLWIEERKELGLFVF